MILTTTVFLERGGDVPAQCRVSVEGATGGSCQEWRTVEGVEDDEVVAFVLAVSGVAEYTASAVNRSSVVR